MRLLTRRWCTVHDGLYLSTCLVKTDAIFKVRAPRATFVPHMGQQSPQYSSFILLCFVPQFTKSKLREWKDQVEADAAKAKQESEASSSPDSVGGGAETTHSTTTPKAEVK